MAQNKRVYFPVEAIGFTVPGPDPTGTGNFIAAKGVQSLRVSTNFSLQPIFQLGQLEIYEHIEQMPEVSVTVDKVIDGRPLLEHLATSAATISTLAGRYNDNRCQAKISYYLMTQDSASGFALGNIFLSGLYVQGINWNIPVQGQMTESITLVGNDKRWAYNYTGVPWTAGSIFGTTGSPILQSGGVLQRENIIMASSLWPTEIPGINGAGVNVLASDGFYTAHLQNVSLGVNLGRTELFELGSKGPYFRYAEFPTEVTCSITVTANESGDAVNAYSTGNNLSNQTIRIWLDQGIIISLGTKAKLTSVETAGGDAGGGNVEVTFNYSTFNDFTVLHPGVDPAGLTS